MSLIKNKNNNFIEKYYNKTTYFKLTKKDCLKKFFNKNYLIETNVKKKNTLIYSEESIVDYFLKDLDTSKKINGYSTTVKETTLIHSEYDKLNINVTLPFITPKSKNILKDKLKTLSTIFSSKNTNTFILLNPTKGGFIAFCMGITAFISCENLQETIDKIDLEKALNFGNKHIFEKLELIKLNNSLKKVFKTIFFETFNENKCTINLFSLCKLPFKVSQYNLEDEDEEMYYENISNEKIKKNLKIRF